MNRESLLFSLVGVGFGLFLGFVFATQANQRGYAPGATPTAGTNVAAQAADDSAAARQAQQPSNAVADPQAMQAAVQTQIKRARENPRDFAAQMEAGKVFYLINRYDEALEFFRRASEIQPANPDPLIQLGNSNYDAGHYEEAERWYAAALAKKPDDINVRTDLGLTFMLRPAPDFDRAIAEFRRSLERDPRHEQTLQNLVVAFTRKKDLGEARRTLTQLEAINPNNAALAQLRSDLQTAGG